LIRHDRGMDSKISGLSAEPAECFFFTSRLVE
jgi:hypothetical protein